MINGNLNKNFKDESFLKLNNQLLNKHDRWTSFKRHTDMLKMSAKEKARSWSDEFRQDEWNLLQDHNSSRVFFCVCYSLGCDDCRSDVSQNARVGVSAVKMLLLTQQKQKKTTLPRGYIIMQN